MRAETGPIKFGDDWTGLFIRGKHAAFYLQNLRLLLEVDGVKQNPYLKSTVEELSELMSSSNERSKTECQELRNYSDCVTLNLNREDQIDRIEGSDVES